MRKLFLIIIGLSVSSWYAMLYAQSPIPVASPKGGTTNVTDTITLDEAVITVAFGKAKKSTYVGSYGEVKAKDMEPRVAGSFVNKLDGLVPGLQVGITGRPGESASLNIRGTSSLTSGNTPLIILNGMQYAGDLSSINSNDIKNLIILKDASATSLYGSRASGGVILITTKTGTETKSNFEVSVQASFGTSWRFIPEYRRTNPAQYYELMWHGIRNNNLWDKFNSGTAKGTDFDNAGRIASRTLITQLGNYNIYNVPDSMVVLPTTGKINPNASLKYKPEDWAKAMLQTQLRQEHNISLSGNTGGGKTNYYISLGFLKDPGIIFNSNFYRYAFNTSVNSQVTRWLKINTNLMYRNSFQENSGNVFQTSQLMPSIYPVYLRNPVNGALLYDPRRGNPLYDFGNTLGYQRGPFGISNYISTNFLNVINNRNNEISGRIGFDIKILPELTFSSTYGVDIQYLEAINNTNAEFGQGVSVGGRTRRSIYRETDFNINNLLNYHKKIGSGDDFHTIDITVGHEFYSRSILFFAAERTGFPAPRLIELSNGSVITDAQSRIEEYRLQGVLTRLTYDYNEKYSAEFSVRGDQSSVFQPGNQWGIFWATGVGWDIAKENFMATQTVVDQLRIRASFGFTGNDGSRALSFYRYQDLYNAGYADLSAPGAVASRLGVPKVSWESIGKGDLGLDIGFFKNRLTFTFDAFYNPVSNMLFEIPIAPSLGFSNITENVGAMYTNGIEFNISGYPIQSEKPDGFSLELALNGYWERNEITKLPNQYVEQGLIEGGTKYMVGEPTTRFFTRRYAGVNDKGEALWHMKTGDKDAEGNIILLKGTNGQPVYDKNGNVEYQNARDTLTTNYNSATRYYLPSYLPHLRGAFHINMSYKGVGIYVLLKYQLGGKYSDDNYANLFDNTGRPGNNYSEDLYTNHSTFIKEGDKVSIQKNGHPLIAGINSFANAASDRFIYDASYLSIKNITLTYKWDKNLLAKMYLKALQFFLSLENVAIFSHLKKGANPESIGGGPGLSYPMLRSLNGGFKLNF